MAVIYLAAEFGFKPRCMSDRMRGISQAFVGIMYVGSIPQAAMTLLVKKGAVRISVVVRVMCACSSTLTANAAMTCPE
jgi:dihydroorotase-like cyclic amidohydrolase